jgi:hypothetical protein
MLTISIEYYYKDFDVVMKKSIQFVILTCLVSWIAARTAILPGLCGAKGKTAYSRDMDK